MPALFLFPPSCPGVCVCARARAIVSSREDDVSWLAACALAVCALAVCACGGWGLEAVVAGVTSLFLIVVCCV